ncbi:DUF3592 domain-containing protein [Massilia sp. R2A-15]|uniref:DUF3592 domain-containing protein n=1 Tax=Massilia sp. R2A-15 TaxID=3064278 RepID=UPI00273358AC|nr:DUF3592 domain-containing protein [Massilia sp. R2A-15]WLI91137.1 DUF3592 domain-containing protein [Massilia sp. R2A-15]
MEKEAQQANPGVFQRVYLLIFCTFIGALSIFGLVHFGLDYAAANAAGSWPTVEGIVIESEPVRGCGKGSSYYPVVKYSYVIDGTTFRGDRVAYGNGCGSYSGARSVTKNFQLGAAVTVHVNPSDSTDSVLTAPGVLPDTWVGVLLAIAGVAFSSWFIWATVFRPSLLFRPSQRRAPSAQLETE